MPYIAENLRLYVTRPPVRSRGDWGQSQFQLGGDDESTHQILSYGLLFLTFYCFPYTAGPPTSTAPTRPSPTIARTFTIIADYTLYPLHHRSGTTSETSHMTYGPHRYIFHS